MKRRTEASTKIFAKPITHAFSFVFIFIVLPALLANCGAPLLKKELTISEQIEVDTKSAEGLAKQFKNQVSFTSHTSAEIFLAAMVKKIFTKQEVFRNEKIEVKIHDDTDPKLRYAYSFPGLTISLPASFVKKVQFENELAAGLAFEIATIMNRNLAKKVEKDESSGVKPTLFSDPSLFGLTRGERSENIHLATQLLLDANYDIRGIASIFIHYPQYYVRESSSDLFQKAVAFNLREARLAKSEFLPQLDPVVRSGEFIQFKKELLHAQP